jgi:hypothetical protein
VNQSVKITPPPEAWPNFGRALGKLASELAKHPKEKVLSNNGINERDAV